MFGRKNKRQEEITVSNQTIIRVILFAGAALLAWRVLENMRHPLTLIFVSFFLTLALNPAVTKLASLSKSKSRIRATAVAYVAVVGVLVGFGVLIVPSLIDQTTSFIRSVPSTLSGLESQDTSLGEFVRRYELQEQIQNFANDWTRNLGSIQGPVINTANRVFGNVVSIITVLVLTFMMLVEGPRWIQSFWKHIPRDRRAHDKEIAAKMYRVVTAFVNGQVLVAAIGAVFALVALAIASTLLDVSVNAVALAAIVFLFSLIPTIGTIIGASIVALFCLFVSPGLALVIIIYFIVYQQIENATIQPLIQSRGNELTPMLVFVAAVLGIGLGGVLGGFLAIPVAGCAKVLYDDWAEDRDLDSAEQA